MDPQLYVAAEEGNLDYLETLEGNTDLQREPTPCNETILHVATDFNQKDFAIKALQICPRLLLLADSTGDTALHIAAAKGHGDMVEFFLSYMQNSDIETGEYKALTRSVNRKKDTALHCAAREGHYHSVNLLAEADPVVLGFVNNAGESPLYLFVALRRWFESWMILKKFVPLSTAISHKGPRGRTALHASIPDRFNDDNDEWQIWRGLIPWIEELVQWRKEMIREGDNLGMTPLHYAAFYGRPDIVGLFLEYDKGAIYIRSNDGKSALHLAAYNGRIQTLQKLLDLCPYCYKMVDQIGRTALHAAVLGNKKEAVKFMLRTPRLQKLINKADDDGNTPLHLAASSRFNHIIQTIANNSTFVRFDILNNHNLTPSQVYMQKISESLQEFYIGSYVLNGRSAFQQKQSKSVMTTIELDITQLNKVNDEGATTYATKGDDINKQKPKQVEDKMKSERDMNLVVAVLVATVTFAAGFTLPGGLVSDGEDEGLANFTNKPTFKAFVVFNSIAFYCSIFVVGFHFINSTMDNNYTRLCYQATVKPFTGYSVLAMLLAFCCGTYVVLTKSTGLAKVPFIIPAFFMSISVLHIRPSYFLIRNMTRMHHQVHELYKTIINFLQWIINILWIMIKGLLTSIEILSHYGDLIFDYYRSM